MVIITVSELLPHRPLLMVHCNTADAPRANPVTVLVGEAGVVIIAVPETTLQVPVRPDEIGILPANAVVVAQATND